MDSTFKKKERLSRNSLIRNLFSDGSSFYLFPFRVTWMKQLPSAPEPVNILLSVPKAVFQRAVDRNKLRRRMKEAYRLNKHILYEGFQENLQPLILCLTYTSKEILPFTIIQEKIILILKRLNAENEKIPG